MRPLAQLRPLVLGLGLVACAHAAGPEGLGALDQDGLACDEGELAARERLGLALLDAGQLGSAQPPLDRACAGRRTASCTGLAELLFDDHPWIWFCVRRQSRRHRRVASLPLRMTGAGSRQPSTLALAAPLPRALRRLGDCIDEALEHTEFPPLALEGEVELDLDLPLDYERAYARSELARGRSRTSFAVSEKPHVSAPYRCPREAPESCEAVEPDRIPVVTRWLDEGGLFGSTFVGSKHEVVYFDYCVDVDGSLFELDQPDYPRNYHNSSRAAYLLERSVARWRFEPLRIDGQAVPACTGQRFDLHVYWAATWPGVRP